MVKYLVIVESPAKAKTIGKFLGKDYKIEASMGHIRDLPKSQLGVDTENNYQPKYINIRGKGDLIKKLKKAAKNVTKIYLATDPDREGEAISWHLANILKINENEKCRIVFNEITKTAVKNAISGAREIDMNLVDAQQARRILDRIVGYKISPLLWKKVKKGLSAGRVQSVTTKLICDREEEIQRFISEEYWSIEAKLSKIKGKSMFESRFHGTETEKIELKNQTSVDEILEEIKEKKFIIKKIKKSQKKKYPYPPFITSTMQQESAKKLGFTTKKTMIVAQQLYEGVEIKGMGAIGLITYMRTDSVRISSEAQEDAKVYINTKYGKEFLPESFRVYKNKSSSQDAHEGIRPSNVNLEPHEIKASLSAEQYKLYKLIWERFVSSQMENALFDTLAVDIGVSKFIFKANGSAIKFQGFLIVYGVEKDDSEENLTIIPELSEGEEVVLKKILPKQHFTEPPARYTEASLVKALEEKGIGRPSTYAPTISTILARYYVQKEQKQLLPTELGKIVTDILKNHFENIVDVKFTANMESHLDSVEEGLKKWEQVIDEFYVDFIKAVNEAEIKIGDVVVPCEVTDILCEKCGRNMVIKMGKFGKFLACPGFPECRNARPILEEAGVNCPICGSKVLNKKTKKGRKYLGCEKNPECTFMTWDKVTRDICPKCQNFLVSKSAGKKSQVKCSNESCDYVKD